MPEDIQNEVEAPQKIVVKDFWGDVKEAIAEAVKNWWASDKDKILSYLGEIGKSIFNYIVNALKKKQSEK